jgi:hypothetical protein
MSAMQSRWRRWARNIAQHSTAVMPSDQSSWADAMRRELDYIEDDAAAFRWAFGGLFTSYRARLMDRPWWRAGGTFRHAAICGALMLVIGLALQDRAGGQTEPAPPPVNETTCDQAEPKAVLPLRSQDQASNRTTSESRLCRSGCRGPSANERPITCKLDIP